MDAISRYRVIRRIDEEDGVEAYEASDDALGRTVLIKILSAGGDEERNQRFEAAAKAEASGASASQGRILHELGRTSDGRPYAVYGGTWSEPDPSVKHGGRNNGPSDATRHWAPASSPGRHRRIVAVFAALVLVSVPFVFFVAKRAGTSLPPVVAIGSFAGLELPAEEAVETEALRETVVSALYRAHGIYILGPSTMQAILAEPDQRAAATRYGAAWYLSATVSSSGGGRVVRASLEPLAKGGVAKSWSHEVTAGLTANAASLLVADCLDGLGIKVPATDFDAMQKVYADPRALVLNQRAAEAMKTPGVESLRRSAAFLEESLRIDPGQLNVVRMLWNRYQTLGRRLPAPENKAAYAKMEDYLSMARKLAAEKGADPYWAAMIRFDAAFFDNRNEDAIKECKAALAVVSGDIRAANNVSTVLQAVGRNDEAIAVLEELLKRDPLATGAITNLGTSYNLAGRWDDTLALMEKARAIQPDNPSWVGGDNALALYMKGDLAGAREASASAATMGGTEHDLVGALVDLAEGKVGPARAVADASLVDFLERDEGPYGEEALLLARLGDAQGLVAYIDKSLDWGDIVIQGELACTHWLDLAKDQPAWARMAEKPNLPTRVLEKW